MKLAIIGAGIIGTTIGRRWTQSGHEVIYGARDPDGERYRDLRAESSVLPLSEALGTADAILIATPGDAIENLLDTQADHLNGRLLMDATNRMGGDRLHQIALFEERVSTARVYRAFNTLGWENFAEPDFGSEGAAGADLLDGLTRLWFTLAFQRGHGRKLAFRTLGL